MSEAPSRPIARRGRPLKFNLGDSTPSGVIAAELGLTSVYAAVASRIALPELIRREEAARTGIYLLVEPDPGLPEPQLVCIGEGAQVKTRLAAHDAGEMKSHETAERASAPPCLPAPIIFCKFTALKTHAKANEGSGASRKSWAVGGINI